MPVVVGIRGHSKAVAVISTCDQALGLLVRPPARIEEPWDPCAWHPRDQPTTMSSLLLGAMDASKRMREREQLHGLSSLDDIT